MIIIKKHCAVELLLKRLNEKGKKKKKKKKMVTVQGNKSLTYLTLKRQVGFKRDQSSQRFSQQKQGESIRNK